MNNKEKIIQNYIEGYNQFDIDKMIADFDESVIFENIQNGEFNLTLTGIKEFTVQPKKAKNISQHENKLLHQLSKMRLQQ